MTNRLRFTAVLAAAVVLAVPHHAGGQDPEPTYSLHLGSGHDMRLTATAGPDALRITGEQKRGSQGKVRLDVRVALDAGGRATGATSRGAGFSGAPVDLSAAVTGGALAVTAPAVTGTSPAAAPVVSFLDLLAVLGRRYDWKRGGPQAFAYVDPGLPRRVATLTAEAAPGGAGGTVTLGKGAGATEVAARRLNLTVDETGIPERGRKVSLWIGPDGEAVQGALPVTGHPVRAGGPGSAAKPQGGEGFVTHYPDGVEPQGNARFTRARRKGAGYALTYEGPADLIRGEVRTDAALNPLAIDHEEDWRRFRARITGTQVFWEVPERRVETPLTGEAWFITHYLLTGAWENRPPFASLKAGQAAQVTYPSVEWGDMNGAKYRVERLEDAPLAAPDGAQVTLRRWRVSSAPYFAADLWTDGRRLVKLASSAGPVIVRDGWEGATKSLSAPPKPAAP